MAEECAKAHTTPRLITSRDRGDKLLPVASVATKYYQSRAWRPIITSRDRLCSRLMGLASESEIIRTCSRDGVVSLASSVRFTLCALFTNAV